MKKTLAAPITLLLAVGTGAPVQAPTSKEAVRKELEAAYARLAEAHTARNLAGVLAVRTADFTTIGPDGKATPTDRMTEYTKHFLETIQPPIQMKTTILELRVEGDTATAVVHQEVSRRQEMAGQVRRVDSSLIKRETWVRTSDGWRLKLAADIHARKLLVDGKRSDPRKPFDPKAPPYVPKPGANE